MAGDRTSSDASDMDDRVVVGKITRTHGVHGEVYIRDDSDNPDRFAPGARFRTPREGFPLLVLRSVRQGPHGLIAAFAGITTIEAAREVCGLELSINATERRALEGDEYWPDQLVGLEVRDESGPIGKVEDVVLGPQDRIVVAHDDGTVGDLPFVDALVPEVNLAEGWVRIDPPEGLFTRR